MELIPSATGKRVTEVERGHLNRALELSIRKDDNVDERPPPPTKSQIHPAEGTEPLNPRQHFQGR